MPTAKHVLCLSYHDRLRAMRERALREDGFEVTSARNFAEACAICDEGPRFDIVVLGHLVPRADKIALTERLRHNCKAPILNVRKHGDPSLRGSDFSVDSYSEPEMLTHAVKLALDWKGGGVQKKNVRPR